MAKIWRNRIIARTRIYNEVPEMWKIQVKNLLKQDVVMGVITPEEYKEFTGEKI